MGKTPGVKRKQQSKHSRASRRAASPSLDVDKSLLALGRPESPPANNPTGQSYHVLGAQGSNGISKKRRNKKETRNQRIRREKGLEKAEMNLDMLEVKREKSTSRARVIKERSKAWEEVDGKKKAKSKGTFEALADQMDEDEWEDEDEGEGPHAITEKPATSFANGMEKTLDADIDEIT